MARGPRYGGRRRLDDTDLTGRSALGSSTTRTSPSYPDQLTMRENTILCSNCRNNVIPSLSLDTSTLFHPTQHSHDHQFHYLQNPTGRARLTAVFGLRLPETLARLDLSQQAATIRQRTSRRSGGHGRWRRRAIRTRHWRGRRSTARRHRGWRRSTAFWHRRRRGRATSRYGRGRRRGGRRRRCGLRVLVLHGRHRARRSHGAEEDGCELLSAAAGGALVLVVFIVAGFHDRPVVVVRGFGTGAAGGRGLGKSGLTLRILHAVERVVVLLGLGRCNGGSAGSGRLLVHALPERILRLLRRTLDCWRAGNNLGDRRCCRSRRRAGRLGRDDRTARRSGVIWGDICWAVVITTVVVTFGFKLSPEHAFSFLSSLDLSTLGSKTSLLLRGLLLSRLTALLLLCLLELASLDLLLKSTKRCFLLFALLLQFAFLSFFLVPEISLATTN